MPAFDADSYFNRRFNEQTAIPAGYDGGPSVSRTKFDELMAASAEKTAALQYNAEQSAQARAASEDSWVNKMGLDSDGVVGSVLNLGAAGVESAVNIPRFIGTSLHTLNAAALDANIPDAAKLAEQRYRANTATPEDMTLLNLTAGMVKEPVWQTPFQKESRKGAQTNLQRIDSMKEALRKGSTVRDTMDVSSIVHRERQQVLEQDLRNGFKPGMAQVSEGWDDVKNGDAVTGSAKSAMGVARLLMNIGTSAVTNPMASLEYVTSNIPQLVLASGGAAGMALTNIPYALEEFGKGITAFQKEHGVLPPAEEMQRMAALAGSLALAETLGDKLTLGAGKVAGLFGKEALETGQAVTRKGFKESLFNPKNSAIGRTGVAVVEGGTGEFATEAYQTTAENAIQGKATSLEDAYVGGAIGAISGGTLSGGMHAGSERAPKAAKPAQSTQPVDSPQQQLDFKAAIASNDPSAFLDQESPSYNPVKAVSVLQANNDNAATAPEVKQANYQQAQTIVTDLDSQLENAKEDYQFARKSPQAKQAEVDFYKAELAKIDPADIESIATYETMVAHYEGMLAPLTAAQARSTEADLSRMDRQLKEARTVKGQMVPPVTPEAFAQQVAAVQAPVDPQDSQAITASKAAATSLINLSMASPELLDPTVARQLSQSTSSGLDDSQREYLRVFSEARIAQNALQDSDSVHQTILYGDNKNDQAGLVQHRERITDAIEAGNKKAAERGLKTLNSFAVDQQGKLTAMQAALDSDVVQKNRQTVQVVKNKDTGQWEQYTGDIPLTEKERVANGGLNIHINSGKLIGSIAAGATAISTAAAEMEAAYGLKFGNVLNKANKTNTSAAPVQKTKESIQVPVVPSLSPSIDKKVLEGRERVNTKVLPLSAGKANWSRYAPAGTGYEVSTQGDTRFSALNAKLADGRTIEEAYQLDVKGFRDPAKLNQSWKDGKGKAPKTSLTPSQTWEAYKGLWQQWAKENPKLIQELRTASAGKTLTDKFAGTPVSQARALAEILAAEASHEATTAQDVPTSPEFSKQADQNLEYLRNPPMDYTPAKATEIGAWAQSKIAALTQAMQAAGEDLDEADRLETLRADMRWMVSKAKEMVEADTVLEENLGPQGDVVKQTNILTADPVAVLAQANKHIADDAASAEPVLTGMKVREATAEETAAYAPVVAEMTKLYPTTAGKVSFLVHTGHRWKGGALSNPTSDQHVITVLEDELAAFMANPEAGLPRIKVLLVHELSHIADVQNIDQDGNWASNQLDPLKFGGYQFMEAEAAARNIGEWVPKKDAAILRKHFGWVISKFKNDPAQSQREMYAQLQALYVVHPDLMEKYLGQTYAAYSGKPAITGAANPSTAEAVSGNDGSTSIGLGETTQSQEPATDEPRVPGVETEEVQPGKLEVFEKAKPAGTLYKLRNILADFFVQKTGNDNDATSRPLVEVKNFLSQLAAGTVTATQFLNQGEALTDPQSGVLALFESKAKAWNALLQKNLVRGNSKVTSNNPEFYFKDLMQFLIESSDGELARTNLDMEENVKTAMSFAAFSWVAENAGKSPWNTPEEINAILGRDENADVYGEAWTALGAVGVRENVIRNGLGQKAIAALGLQLRKNAPPNEMAKLESAMGAHIARLLMEVGILERNSVKGDVMNALVGKGNTQTGASFQFLKLVRDAEGVLNEQAETIKQANKGTQGVLNRLFSVEAGLKEPSLTPIPFKQKTTKNTKQGVPAKLAKVIKKANAEANYIRQDMWNLLDHLSPAVALAIAGVQEVSDDTTHVVNQAGLHAKNDGLAREYDQFMEYVRDVLTPINEALDMPLFFEHLVWKQQRVGIATNVINPQTSKIHRFLMFRKAWETKVTLTDSDQMENFRLRVLEGLGVKTDKQANVSSVAKYNDITGTPSIQAAVAVLVKTLQGQDITEADQQALLAGVKEGKSNFHSLDALMALAQEATARENKQDSFTVQMMGEVDGVANGPMLTHLLLGAAQSVQDMFRLLNRGGFFEEGSKHNNYNVWRDPANGENNRDLYENTTANMTQEAQYMMDESPSVKEELTAVYAFTGALTDGDNVTKEGRNIIKTPLTAMLFGSSLDRSIESMADSFMGTIYGKIEDLAKGKGDLAQTIAHLNTLIGSTERIRPNTTVAQLMGQEFSKHQIAAIKGTFTSTLGEAVRATLEKDFATFIDSRKVFNQSAKVAFDLYNAVYMGMKEQLIAELIQQEIEAPGTGLVTEIVNKIPTPVHDLTAEQEQVLQGRVKAVAPMLHTLLSKESEDLDSGLFMSKSERKLSTRNSHKGRVQFASQFKDNNSFFTEVTGYETLQANPGVAMLPMSIHSTDSYISHMAAMLGEVLNVHDAHGAGLGTFEQTAKNLNEATWNAMMGYSPASEMRDSLARVINGLAALLKEGNVPPEVIKNLNLVLKDTAKSQKTSPGAVLAVMMGGISQMARASDTIKYGALAQMGSVDQYALQGGQYEVKPEQRAEAAAIEASLQESKGMPSGVQGSLDSITKYLQSYKAPAKALPAVNMETPISSGMDDQGDGDSTHTATGPRAPTPFSTQELYAALPSTVSGTFDAHLKGLLDGMVSKLHGPFGSFKQAIMTAQPLGPLERMAKAQAEGKAPLTVSALASGIRFSDQEAFVIEQVQATVKATLEGNDGQTAITYGELSKLFMEAKKRIVPADFATGDPAQDQAIHDFLLNHTDAGKGNRSDYLARFAAVGLAHEGFNKLLQVETSRAAPVLKGEKTIAAFLKRAFYSLLDWFNGRMSNTQPGQKGSEKLTALVGQLVQIELKRQARAADTSFDIVDAFDEKSKALADGVAAKLGEIGKSAFFQQSRSKVLKASGSLVSMVAEDRVKWLVEGMNKFRDQYMDKEQGVIAAVFKDIVGYAAQQQVLLRMAVKNQGERKDIITNTTKLVRESFVNQGKDLTDQAKSALTAVLLRTGAHTLLSPTFDTAQLQELLNDVNKLTAAIQAQEAMLSVFPARFQNYFLRQSKDLAHYLVHSEAKGQHLMLNAGNIARMYETIHAGKLSEVETQQAEAIIDSLVSLYALKMSSTGSKAEVVTMMKAEHARGDGGNGVQMALLLHKDMEQQAKERLFGDSPALMVKGYTPEIYNPYTAIQVVNAEEGALLLDHGYARGDAVQPDPADPGAEAKHVYVLRDGGAQPLQTGILSYTGTRHKGSTLHSGKNTKLQKQVLLGKQAAIDKMFEPNPKYDPAKGRGTHMVPLLNATGKAVNYHYMMTAKTKDALLERNSRFDDVLGVQAGSVFDKATVGEQNRKAIQALKDSYLEDFKNNPQAYVQVGLTSPDAENRELYKLLPKVTQQAITDIWGKEGLMVRSDHKALYFGYHKLSLSSAWDKVGPNLMERALVTSVTWALENYAKYYLHMDGNQAKQYAKRGAVVVRRGENIWQAVVREIKDIYVIKAVTTMLNNIVSNLSLLHLNGVPVLDSLRYHQEAMRGASDYERDTAELFKLEQQIKVGLGMGDLAEAKQKVSRLKDAIARNPVKPLIDAGLMPTIVEDVEADVDPFSYKSQFLRKTEKYTSKLNPGVRKAARTVFMAHDTQMYKTLHHFTQLSDFVARYALYQHLTTRKKNALASPEALHAASEAFIFYDIPMHRKLQYVEDMGLVMFTKYFMRIQRVLARRVKENPGRVLTSILTHHFIGGVPGVMDASAIAHFGNNPLSTGALGFPGALPDLGTVQAMDGMLGLLK